MTGLEPLLRILAMLVALALGERFPAPGAVDERAFLPLVANLRAGASGLAEREPLDGPPPRRLIPLADAEALDGPADARRPGGTADRRSPAQRAGRESAAQSARAGQDGGRERRGRHRPVRERRPVRETAGNGGTASASANGGAVAIGSIPGDANVAGNATVVETSTEDGIAIAIDASGDAVTASAAGEDGTRAGPRLDRHRSARDRPGRRGPRSDG